MAIGGLTGQVRLEQGRIIGVIENQQPEVTIDALQPVFHGDQDTIRGIRVVRKPQELGNSSVAGR
jgi:hypothetical protein